jgi:transcriptional regulator with XRE-family HTH domain
MKQESQSQLFHYTPEAFLERLCERLGARSLSALGRVVGLSPSVLSKVRRRRLAISSEILLKIHDATDIPVRELRRWMGDMRPYFSRVQLASRRA